MTGGAVSLSLVAVLGLLLLIGWRGLVYFWPHPIYEWQLEDASGNKSVLIGEINDRELVPVERLRAAGQALEGEEREEITRYLVKTGNREFVDLDFRWVLETDIKSRTQPAELAMVERATNGNFYGYITSVKEDGQELTTDLHPALQRVLARANGLSSQANDLQKGAIGSINYQLERLRLKERKAELDDKLTDQLKAELASERQALNDRYQVLEKELFSLRTQADRDSITVKDMRGELVTMPMSRVLDVVWPNDMSLMAKVGHWFHQIGKFVSDDPREANTEGGVFPAIFGTVFMVILMAIIVTPLGVVAAVYLHEYAGKNSLTKIIRIAVINLAGVPSIVYGVFGLGFFVYTLGAASTASSTRKRCRARPSAPRCHLVCSDPGHPDLAGGDRLHRRGAGPDPEHHSPGFAGAGCHPGRDPVAHRAAHGQPGHHDRPYPGHRPCGGRGGAADAGGGGEACSHVADGRQLPVPARGAQVHAPGLPHL